MRFSKASKVAGALVLALVASALAQNPPRGPSAERLVLDVLRSYDSVKQAQPEKWPLVPRLRDALRRTDLGSDVLTGDKNAELLGLIVEGAEFPAERRARVRVRYLLGKEARTAVFELDASEGEWLIAEIQPSAGPSFRALLGLRR